MRAGVPGPGRCRCEALADRRDWHGLCQRAVDMYSEPINGRVDGKPVGWLVSELGEGCFVLR